MSEGTSFRRRAVSALIWSTVQIWGGRIIGLIVFVLLARLLSPAEFGIASSAFLVMTFANMLAELGCSDALVQRKDLKPEDANLPFFGAMAISISLASVMAILADRIAGWMGVEGLAPYLRGTAAICPFMTMLSFQETLYRRAVMFRQLALRTILSTVVGGVVGIGGALTGWGTWSLIAQFGAQTLVGLVWLWWMPIWRPTLVLRYRSAIELASFGSKVLAMFLIDFMTQKSVDLIILLIYGPTSLGFFTVSSRLYILLLQVLQTSINRVGLTMLAKITDDLERVRRLYLRSTSLCATFGTPVFFALAAAAPEVNHVMFGAKWAGAERVMIPLLLIGGIHCIQFINASYVTAMGRPQTLLRLTVAKAFLVLPPLYLIDTGSAAGVATLYAGSLLALTPLDFWVTLRILRIDWRSLVRPIGVPLLACLAAFVVTLLVRSNVANLPANDIVRMAILGICFSLTYLVLLASFGWSVAQENLLFAYNAVRR